MKDVENVIKVSCECKDFLKFSELTDFQGELKKRNDDDIDKIVRSIKKYGFSFPFFVWKHDGINHVLDGHGRLSALRKLDELGYLLPSLPVVYVNCENEKAAKDLLLRLNSQYGKMTRESVLDFIGDLDIDVSAFELPAGTLDFEIKVPSAKDLFAEDNTEEASQEMHKLKCPCCNEYFLIDDKYRVIEG